MKTGVVRLVCSLCLVVGCGTVAGKKSGDAGAGGALDSGIDVPGTGGAGGGAVDALVDSAREGGGADAALDHVSTCPAGMVFVAGGTYTPTAGSAGVLPDYCMDANEVTAADFAQCVSAGLCDVAYVNVVADPRCFYGKTGKGTFPMNCLATPGAIQYCQKNGKHLPSEGEWEWAARGGPLANLFPWGTDVPDTTNLKLCWNMAAGAGACETRTHPAGNTASGLYDLAGNVAELVSARYSTGFQVVKGGSYIDTVSAAVQVVARAGFSDSDANPDVGFRCASAPQ